MNFKNSYNFFQWFRENLVDMPSLNLTTLWRLFKPSQCSMSKVCLTEKWLFVLTSLQVLLLRKWLNYHPGYPKVLVGLVWVWVLVAILWLKLPRICPDLQTKAMLDRLPHLGKIIFNYLLLEVVSFMLKKLRASPACSRIFFSLFMNVIFYILHKYFNFFGDAKTVDYYFCSCQACLLNLVYTTVCRTTTYL